MDQGTHYVCLTAVRNYSGVHVLLDDSLSTIALAHQHCAASFLDILRQLSWWGHEVQPAPALHPSGKQTDGYQCGAFSLLSLEKRLLEVWCGQPFESVSLIEADRRRRFLQLVLKHAHSAQ